jgi:O-antigen/teichoic acid export membrane protein
MYALTLRILALVLGRCPRARRLVDAVKEQTELATVAGWSFVAAIIARSANLLALVICARLLSQEQFGQVAIIQGTVGMFGPIAGLGLSMTTTKFLAEYREKDPARAGRIVALSLSAAAITGALMTAALILLAPLLATKGLASPGLRGPLILASGLLLLGVIDAVQIGALTGLEAFSRIARLSAWNGVLSLPIIAMLAHTWGAQGAIAGLTIALAWSCTLNGIMLRAECRKRGIRPSFSGWTSELGMLWMFSLPSYLTDIVVAPVTWMASALLVRQPGGLAEMALFTAADRFRFLLVFVPISVSRIALPALTRLRSAGNHGGYRDAFRWNLGFGLLATVPPVLVCIAVSRPLMSWFGESFAQGWLVLAILAFSAVPTVLNTQLGAALVSDNRVWARAGTAAVLSAAFFLSARWMVPVWKAAGLAASFAIAYTITCIALWICLRYKPRPGRTNVAVPVALPAFEVREVSLEKPC